MNNKTVDPVKCIYFWQMHTKEFTAKTKKMIMELVGYAQMKEYENIEDFANFIGKSVLNKLQKPS
jgi:hypothetical protein